MSRFIRRGTSQFYFAPTLAVADAVARAELDTATKLTDDIADVSGWMLENSPVGTPDMGSTFDKSIPGVDQAQDSSLTFYEDTVDDAIEAVLTKGAEGYIVIMRKGDVPASESMDIFPVQVASRAAEFSAGNDPARFSVRFTITDVPALDRPVPAAV